MSREHKDSFDEMSSDNEPDCQCTVCSKRFKSQTYLREHMQKHGEKYKCEQCGKMYSFSTNLRAHQRKVHRMKGEKTHTCTSRPYTCDMCQKSFGRNYHLIRHRALVHQLVTPRERHSVFPCNHCATTFNRFSDLIEHLEQQHPLSQHGGHQDNRASKTVISNDDARSEQNDNHQFKTLLEEEEDFKTKTSIESDTSQENSSGLHDSTTVGNDQSALGNHVQHRTITPRQNERYDALTFLGNIRDDVMSYLTSRVEELGGIKWSLCLQVELQRDGEYENNITQPFFRSRTYISLSVEDMNEHDLNEAFQKIVASLEKYMREGSGWFVKEVLKLEIHTVVYRPISASSYIPLPKTLSKSNSILNIRNYEDQKCFMYSILASLHPANMLPEDPSIYKQYEQELSMMSIQYPVSLSDIRKFENQNPNISVNVFTFDSVIVPLRVTAEVGRLHHINLLLLTNENTNHYCLIKDLNRFLSRTNTRGAQSFFCAYCLHGFTREDLLTSHQSMCSTHGPQRVDLPSEDDDVLTFKDYEKTLKVPFVIYADFETVNRKLHTCMPNPKTSACTPTTKLEVCGFGYKVVCENERYTKPTVVYRGADAATKLVQSLLHEQTQIESILSDIKPMNIRAEHENLIEMAKQCCICDKDFTLYDRTYSRIVRHHNHLTGEIIGAACNTCNLSCKQAKFTPVIFHNLRNFDAHILCETLGQFKQYRLSCIPQNSERYISLSLGRLRFLDSFQFLPTSLETLVCDLKKDGLDKFSHTMSEFDQQNSELLIRKGVYPYDYVDTFERFTEPNLPPREEFYNSLTKEHISTEDYSHAQRVFREFQLSSMGDYHDLYLKTDVLLLCDVFESFRKTCFSNYSLECCHYYSAPGLGWGALLKMSKVRLELLKNIDQVNLIQAGIRGGLSQISNRYKKANNPYLPDFDPSQPKTYLQYLDANNLYAWSMVQALPLRDFLFLENVSNFDVMEIAENGELGYILEVDLHYPEQLHELHNDLPLAPEHKVIRNEQLSPYAIRLLRQLYALKEDDSLPARAHVSKLLTTLDDKNNYVLHYRNLQLYLQLGMKLTRIHRILQFKQYPWMKSFIEFNTEKRKVATSKFEQNFYKLMNCSVFGKTIEDVRKHRNIELVHREERLRKLSAKPTYKDIVIFNEELVAVELLRCKVKLYKPIYSGLCILDLSKWLMYRFWYGYIKHRYPSATLMMTDTDSVLFHCHTEDIYDDMKSRMELFDTSEYDESHPLYSIMNKKVLGLFKDETKGVPISEFVGLRSKMYSLVCKDKQVQRAKGIARATVRKDIRHAHYKYALFSEARQISNMTLIRSHQHELTCQQIQKTGLSPFDDKRYLLNHSDSYAYSHYKIKNHREDTQQNKSLDVLPMNNQTALDSFDILHDQEFTIGPLHVSPCVRK